MGEKKWMEIISLATPVVISKLSFTAMALVDTAMVGRLGASEQAAVGIATTFLFTVYVFGLGLISSVNTLVSQHHGAGQPERCGIILGHGLRLSTIIGVVTFAVLALSRPAFSWAGLSEAVAESGYAYLLFRIFGLFGVFWYWTYNAFFEGIGQTRTPMVIALVANVINIVLDYVLIFGLGPIPAMGVQGAGLATALSNLFMLACFVFVVHRRRSPYRRFGTNRLFVPVEWPLMRKMVRLGVPMGGQFFAEIGAFLVFSVFVGWVSDEALAAHQVALRLWSVSFMTAWGISIAATTLVGRHQGAGKSELAFAVGMRSLVLTLGFTALVGAVYMAIPGILSAAFTAFADVARIATVLMYVCAINQVFDGINIVAYGALKGAGDTSWPLRLVVLTNWGLGVPLVYLLTIVVGLGPLGTWFGIMAVLGCQAMAMFLRFKGGKWREIRLVEDRATP